MTQLIHTSSNLVFKTNVYGGKLPFAKIRDYDGFWKEKLDKHQFRLKRKDENPVGFLVKEFLFNHNTVVKITPEIIEIQQTIETDADDILHERIINLATICHEGVEPERIDAIGINGIFFLKTTNAEMILSSFFKELDEEKLSDAHFQVFYNKSNSDNEDFFDKIAINVSSGQLQLDSALHQGIVFHANYNREIKMLDGQAEAIDNLIKSYEMLYNQIKSKVILLKDNLLKEQN